MEYYHVICGTAIICCHTWNLSRFSSLPVAVDENVNKQLHLESVMPAVLQIM